MAPSATRSLVAGDLLPHFSHRTIDGGAFSYSTIWQNRNLLLVALTHDDAGRAYADTLRRHTAAIEARATALSITTEPLNILGAPGVLVADRWGEVAHVATSASAADLPSPEALLDWLDYLQQRCPECEGEAR